MRALHFDRYVDIFRLHCFLLSEIGPVLGQPAAFHSRRAIRLRQQRVDRYASCMHQREFFERLTREIVENEMDKRDLDAT